MVSSTNKTDRHDITEILLKVALNTIKPTKKSSKLPVRFELTSFQYYLNVLPCIIEALMLAAIHKAYLQINNRILESSKRKESLTFSPRFGFEFTGPNQILEFII